MTVPTEKHPIKNKQKTSLLQNFTTEAGWPFCLHKRSVCAGFKGYLLGWAGGIRTHA
jgi:hypothetical protein